MRYAFASVSLIFCALTVAAQIKSHYTVKLILKTVASFSFLAVAFASLAVSGTAEMWRIMLITGLVLGFAGDIFLASKGVVNTESETPMLFMGLVFFLLGHLAYIAALALLSERIVYLTLIIAPVSVLAVYLAIETKILSITKEKIPVLVYSAILGLMAALALSCFITSGFSVHGALFFAASALFMLSDFLLGIHSFGNEKLKDSPIVSSIYLPAYYIAQILFAFAVAF